jgi:hypothetical protein
VSGDRTTKPATESTVRGMDIAEAFVRTGSIIHRVRYLEELLLVEKHVHAEALTVRDPERQQMVARGIRIVMRLRPVDEPPRDHGPIELPQWTPEPIAPGWLDPVPEGPPYQQSQTVFVDHSEMPRLLEGFDGLAQTADRWSRDEVYSTSAWIEAVFALSDAFIVGLVRRAPSQDCYIASRTPLRLHFPIPAHRLGRVRSWLKRAKAALDEAP